MQLPIAPIAPRTGAATDYAVWEDRIYVWGGRGADGALLNDGAAFLIEDQKWLGLPETPLVPRERFGFDSDNRGITIWGGLDADGQPLADGARLLLSYGDDDDTMTWAVLPAAPLTPGPASLTGDTNVTLAVTPGIAPGDAPRFAVLDDDDNDTLGWDEPATANRRIHGEMPAPPIPSGIAYEIASARDNAVLVSYQPDSTAIVSWFTGMWPGEWSDPEQVPLPASSGCPALDIPSFGWVRAGADGAPVGLIASEQGGETWRRTATPPDEALTDGMLVWSPRHLIVADSLLAYDTVTKRWLRLPPLPDGPRTGISAAWGYGNLYVWGGRTADGALPDTGWVFTPDLPRHTYRLPGGYRAGYFDCGGVGDPRNARFRADRGDRARVWLELDGQRIETSWPDGYVVRFGRRAAVIGPDGRIAAREGRRLRDTDLGYCPHGDHVSFQ